MPSSAHYIEHLLSPELKEALSQSIRILDFETGDELAHTSGKRLEKVGTFLVPPPDTL
jgi:hypothetical protein